MRVTVVLVLAGLVAACAASSRSESTPANGAAGEAQARFDRAADEFYWKWMQLHPDKGSGLGYHQYDGKLPDVSAAGIAAEVSWLREQQRTFAGFAGAELSGPAQVEREVVLATVRAELFDLDVVRAPWRNPMWYVWPLDPEEYITRDYAPLADRARGLVGLCDGLSGYFDQAMANLEAKLPRTWIETARLQVNGSIEFIQTDVQREMAGLESPLKLEVTEGLGRCVNALAEYDDFLEARSADATDQFALGEELFLRMLRDKEGVDTTIARLDEIAQADLERNTAAIAEAAKELAPDVPTAEEVAAVFRDKPAADQVLATATQQAVEMRQFLIDHDIVTIPSDDVAEVRESPPFMRWNFAFLDSPGPYETKPLPGFYYISPPDPSWPVEVQRAYVPSKSDLLFTTIHEVWPGHFLHALHKKKNASKILTSFCSYSMSEGWAHYTEEMMWDAGAGKGSAEMHIGQLQNALVRDVRFVASLGMHVHGMTVEQSQKLFEERAFADAGNAQQQAVRGTFDPGYLNYTLGKLMIVKLRDDWKAKVGDAYSPKAFHDEFLSYGCAPVPVIRRFMLGDDAGPAL